MYKIMASGNLVADPELRYSKDGKAYCNLRIAINTGKDKPATFKDVICFSYLAENVGSSLLKGDKTIVCGRIETQSWEDKEGTEHTKEQIIAEDCGPSLMFAEADMKRKAKVDYQGDNKNNNQGELGEEFQGQLTTYTLYDKVDIMKQRKKHTCNRCSYEWFSNKAEPPVTCPSCRSPYWNKERTYKIKKEKR